MRTIGAMPAIIAGLLAAIGMAASPAHAAPIDLARANAGGSPFSDQLPTDAPTDWSFYTQALANTPGHEAWRFSETDAQGREGIIYGHIVKISGRGSMQRWAVIDILAWVPAPYPLHELPDEFVADGLDNLPLPPLQGRLDIASASLRDVATTGEPDDPQPIIVPEPASLLLLLLGVALFHHRRPRQG